MHLVQMRHSQIELHVFAFVESELLAATWRF
jgi:hypothetical protein